MSKSPLSLLRSTRFRGLACLIGIVAAVSAYYYNIGTHTAPLIPTQQLSDTKSVGGTPASKNTAHTDDSPRARTTTEMTPSSPLDKAAIAPRQKEITKSVITEYQYRALGPTPNDPYFSGSWLHQRTGATNAWNISTGSTVTIAVIDTGFALNHEDLVSQWKINASESGSTTSADRCWTGTSQNKSTNNCDDDANGYIDDWRGWNFITTSNNPQAGTMSSDGTDAISHGTSVAGLAGAATNNGKGVASFNWNVKLMPLAALDDNGSGFTSGVIAAIYYAVDNGASIINLSLGGPEADPALQAAVDYAYAHNIVVVAAAGNCGTTGDAGCYGLPAPTMMYPAKNNHVIAVGASDASDNRASFSSYGPALDVVAPGYGTLVSPLIDTRTQPYNYTNAYSANLYGTSFASPIVSSIASLIRSIRPSASVDDITALIDGSATKAASMNGQIYTLQHGHGVINAGSASVITDALMQSPEGTPVLAQTGDHQSEHSFSSTATMSSGCTAAALTYCTVRMTDTNGYDRYLPYTRTSVSGTTGWQWSGGILQPGEWMLQAIQGSKESPNSYLLFSK